MNFKFVRPCVRLSVCWYINEHINVHWLKKMLSIVVHLSYLFIKCDLDRPPQQQPDARDWMCPLVRPAGRNIAEFKVSTFILNGRTFICRQSTADWSVDKSMVWVPSGICIHGSVDPSMNFRNCFKMFTYYEYLLQHLNAL